MTDKGRNISGL